MTGPSHSPEAEGRLFVLGHPVAHSKSPAMHNAAYRALGLNWSYGLADCSTEDEARDVLERRDWLAMNVTMPYKPLAFDVASWRSDAALLANGANVLVRRGDELLADNTDGKGCIAYLKRCGVNFDGARVVVCGTGPTSLAIMHAAAQAGAGRVALLGRDEAKATRSLDEYRSRAQVGCELSAGSYARASGLVAEAGVVIDATPLGMHEGDPAPFDTALLVRDQVVFDVVYGHGTTALIGAASQVGCAAYDGAGMLVSQAVETVRDIVEWLDVPVRLEDYDLFAIMAQAAGFDAAIHASLGPASPGRRGDGPRSRENRASL